MFENKHSEYLSGSCDWLELQASKLAVMGDVAVYVCSVMVTAQGWFKQVCTLHLALGNARSSKSWETKQMQAFNFLFIFDHVFPRLELDTHTNFDLWFVHCPQVVAGAAEAISECVVNVEVTYVTLELFSFWEPQL